MAFQERYGEIRHRIVQIILAVLLAPLFVFSISPASATIFADSLTLDSATDVVGVNETATAMVTAVFVATSKTDTMSVTVIPISAPTGQSKVATIAELKTMNGITAKPTSSNSIDISTTSENSKLISYLRLSVPNLTNAGTYVFGIYPTLKSGSGTLSSTYQTWTITVREPNFKVNLTNSASSTSNKVQIVLTNPKDFPNNSWAVNEFDLDAEDKLNTYLEDGTYQVRVMPNSDEGSTRVASQAYAFRIASGILVPESTSAPLSGGFYQLVLGTTGLNVTATIGGTTKAFNIVRISAANGVTKEIIGTYFEDKRYSLALDPGSYRIQIQGSESKFFAISSDCIVTSGSVSACDVVVPADNFHSG